MRLVGVLDPGHGGHDPGCIGTRGTKEKDLTLRYALDLEAELVRRGHTITVTRREDVFVTLGDRCKLANNLPKHADFLVSIHFDYSGSPQPHGTWAFYHNAITYLADGRINEWPSVKGQPLAGALVQHVTREAGTHNRMIAPRPQYRNGERVEGSLAMLRDSKPWAALVEVCFLSNPADEALAITDDFRARVVLGMANGIEEWARNYLL